MKMSFDQTRRQICAAKIDNFIRLVIAEPDHTPVIDGHIGQMNLATENVNDPRVSKKLLRRLFSARNGELVLDLPHPIGTVADFFGVARRCSIAMKIASGVAGEGSAIWPPDLPNAATALRIPSCTEIAYIHGASPTALVP